MSFINDLMKKKIPKIFVEDGFFSLYKDHMIIEECQHFSFDLCYPDMPFLWRIWGWNCPIVYFLHPCIFCIPTLFLLLLVPWLISILLISPPTIIFYFFAPFPLWLCLFTFLAKHVLLYGGLQNEDLDQGLQTTPKDFHMLQAWPPNHTGRWKMKQAHNVHFHTPQDEKYLHP